MEPLFSSVFKMNNRNEGLLKPSDIVTIKNISASSDRGPTASVSEAGDLASTASSFAIDGTVASISAIGGSTACISDFGSFMALTSAIIVTSTSNSCVDRCWAGSCPLMEGTWLLFRGTSEIEGGASPRILCGRMPISSFVPCLWWLLNLRRIASFSKTQDRMGRREGRRTGLLTLAMVLYSL